MKSAFSLLSLHFYSMHQEVDDSNPQSAKPVLGMSTYFWNFSSMFSAAQKASTQQRPRSHSDDLGTSCPVIQSQARSPLSASIQSDASPIPPLVVLSDVAPSAGSCQARCRSPHPKSSIKSFPSPPLKPRANPPIPSSPACSPVPHPSRASARPSVKRALTSLTKPPSQDFLARMKRRWHRLWHAPRSLPPAAHSTTDGKYRGNPNARYFTSFDLVSIGHSIFVLLFGTLSFFYELSRLSAPGMPWDLLFNAPSSRLQTIVLTLSTLYFLWDILVILFTRPYLNRREIGLVVHHVISVTSLLGPLHTLQDGAVVLGSLIIGEMANPPRFVSQICHRSKSKPCPLWWRFIPCLEDERREKTAEWLRVLHIVLFLASRLIASHYVAHVVLPIAVLPVTRLCAILMLAISVVGVGDYITSQGPKFVDGGSTGILL